jgi:hypothetical protein
MSERLGGGEPNRAADERVASGGDTIEIQRRTFHGSALPQDRLPGWSGGEAVRRSAQQRYAQAFLQ